MAIGLFVACALEFICDRHHYFCNERDQSPNKHCNVPGSLTLIMICIAFPLMIPYVIYKICFIVKHIIFPINSDISFKSIVKHHINRQLLLRLKFLKWRYDNVANMFTSEMRDLHIDPDMLVFKDRQNNVVIKISKADPDLFKKINELL